MMNMKNRRSMVVQRLRLAILISIKLDRLLAIVAISNNNKINKYFQAFFSDGGFVLDADQGSTPFRPGPVNSSAG